MSLGLQEKKHILVCNKIDLCDELPVFSSSLHYSQKCFVSCVTGQGLEELLAFLKELAQASDIILEMSLPYNEKQGQLVAQAHRAGHILSEEYGEAGVDLKVQIPLVEARKYFREYLPSEFENETKW